MLRYYPVFLDIKDRTCVVIGGGPVAERKVNSLVRAGASVTVISPRATRGIASLARSGTVLRVRRAYRRGDLEGAALVVSAAGAKAVNRLASEEAKALGIPVNVVDAPELSSFIVPSVVDRAPLVFAVSTSGECPAYSRTLREALDNTVGAEFGPFVELLGAVRRRMLKNGVKNVKKDRVLEALIGSPIPAWIREGERSRINSYLKDLLGDGFTLGRLGIRLSSE